MKSCGKCCAYCHRWFHSDPRLGDKQKSCFRKRCGQARKREAQAQWVANNRTYFRGPSHVQAQKRWLAKPGNTDYLRRYRASHPDGVAADNRRRSERRRLQKARERLAKVSDMKDEIHRREIARIRGLSASDMKDTIPLQLDGLFEHLSTCPWSWHADMKDAMAFVPGGGVG